MPEQNQLSQICEILSETGNLLVSNGANATRTARNLHRMAGGMGCEAEFFFSHSALIFSILHKKSGRRQTVVKSIKGYHVNYGIVSEISILSWDVAQKKMTPAEIQEKLTHISRLNGYPEWAKLTGVALATAGLTGLFGGGIGQMAAGFIAAALGYAVRGIVLRKKFNMHVAWFIGAAVSAGLVELFSLIFSTRFDGALTASVLWLIPGVPLTNGCLDLISGQVVSGWAKLAMAMMMVAAVALGFSVALLLFGNGTGIL
ncbi:threonine/serine exporter family protein [Cruoricaptor ignavus]|uniref:Threonine/serine exporter family protein n=1 Tax=Cruoricaptor ignavus TaxID=1118202 RepID=A0A7M1T314_9FLAO|nr:threonine/serine exporter family protein [Cruoricaptor ignavus]QOR73303.1 threonine/serine exporter family protein [Cruoricaptor ignavus]